MLYFWSLLAIMIFAYLDELLQFSGIGGRSFSYTAIKIDWFSAFLGQLLIVFVLRPKLAIVELKLNRYTRKFSQLQKVRDRYEKK